MAFPGVSRGIVHHECHVVLSSSKTGNNVIEMSQAFHDIARLERFTDLNLFKYEFSVIQNWETDALQFYLIRCSFFC